MKRLFMTFAAMLLMSVSAFAQSISISKCDVNEDGEVDISDIVAIVNQIAGKAFYRYADVNEDESVDISDIVAVINIIATK